MLAKDKIYLALLEGEPATKREISKRLKIGYETVINSINHLHRECKVHICDWQGGGYTKGTPCPIYKAGEGKDMERPKVFPKAPHLTKTSSEQIDAIQDTYPIIIREPGRIIHFSGVKSYKEYIK